MSGNTMKINQMEKEYLQDLMAVLMMECGKMDFPMVLEKLNIQEVNIMRDILQEEKDKDMEFIKQMTILMMENGLTV